MKTESRKRLESFAWRGAMMTLAFILDYSIKNITQLNLDPSVTIFIGLFLGEVSKYLKSRYDLAKEVEAL
jgi:hypothetical protein